MTLMSARARKARSSSTPTASRAPRHDDKTGDDVEREIPFLKGYTVFNVEQIDGLPDIYYAKAAPTLDPVARIEHAEKFFAATGAAISHGGNRAYYAAQPTHVQMPPFEPSATPRAIYSTLAHETDALDRTRIALDRDFGSKRFGSNAYAQEELVAELGAAFLCADLELTLEPREDHAAYIANWLQVLKNDNRDLHRREPRAARRGLSPRLAEFCSHVSASRGWPSIGQ